MAADVIGAESESTRDDYESSEDDNVLVQGVAGTEGATGYFGYTYYEENQDTPQGAGDRQRRGLRRAVARDRSRRQLHAAVAAAVHLRQQRQVRRQRGHRGVRRLLHREPRRSSPRRPSSSRSTTSSTPRPSRPSRASAADTRCHPAPPVLQARPPGRACSRSSLKGKSRPGETVIKGAAVRRGDAVGHHHRRDHHHADPTHPRVLRRGRRGRVPVHDRLGAAER